jgi:hypothetical protein
MKPKQSSDYLSFNKVQIIPFHISGKNIHNEIPLTPLAFSPLLFGLYHIPFHNMGKLPYKHLHFDIFNHLIKKSVFGGYQ